MMMMGLKFRGTQPFDHVYIHALIRDAEGQKMSKSKGNVVDPLKMTDAYGTDAVRFTLAAYAAQGRDIKFSEERVEGYRHFLNKIWNVARFISMNLREGDEILTVRESDMLSLADKWILSRLSSVSMEVNRALDEYRFNDSASHLYQFIWHELCDWYVELIKPALYGDNESGKQTAVSTLVHVYEAALALLHPFMPFVTEEIWQQLPGIKDVESICIRKYPTAENGIENKEAEQKMAVVMDAITGIRSIRGELNISPSVELKALIRAHDSADLILNENVAYINTLARTKDIVIGKDIESPRDAAADVKPAMEIFVPLKGLIDVEAEISRLTKDLKKTEDEIAFLEKKLKNENFVKKAPQAVVEENRAKHTEYIDKLGSIQSNIDKLKKMDTSQ